MISTSYGEKDRHLGDRQQKQIDKLCVLVIELSELDRSGEGGGKFVKEMVCDVPDSTQVEGINEQCPDPGGKGGEWGNICVMRGKEKGDPHCCCCSVRGWLW